jgi:superoxide dismutase, Cu-Zn family
MKAQHKQEESDIMKSKRIFSLLFAAFCVLVSLFFFQAAFSQEASQPVATEARATLLNQAGKEVGEATFSSANGSLGINVSVSGLTPGDHGLHIHERGECKEGFDPAEDAVVPFGAAGGHLDPFVTRNHDAPDVSSEQSHAGDLPMITIAEDGTGNLSYSTAEMTLTDDPASILNRSLVIHAEADDYATDPAGNSGERLICGVILAAPSAVLERLIVPGGATYPEGIALAPDASAVFTGSSNDGTIYRVPLDGSEAQKFSLGGSPGRTAALGMKVHSNGKLIVAGGGSGMVAILDTTTGMTERVLRSLEAPPSYMNDLTVTGDGTVYVTDSFRPFLYRFNVNEPSGVLEPWLDLSTTPIEYQPGQINLNGIVSSADGTHLVTVQLVMGQLWHIDTVTQAVTEISLEQPLTAGDGLVLEGTTLYVVQNSLKQISVLELAEDYSAANLTRTIQDANFKFPTTAVLHNGELLVVNAQLDKLKTNAPVQPFYIARVSLTDQTAQTPQ